jgi:DNA-binding NtrC family response regulator
MHGGRGREDQGSENAPPAAVGILSGLLRTPSLAPLADRLALAAASDVTILLTGETGTGKSHLAGLIHENSPRRGQPLHVVSCAALSPGVIMSELFGHVRGAFTGADRARKGKFEAAGRGTLLLDEIDTLSPETQAAVLRVIETGEFEPLGSNATQLCQARIIAASNWDLEKAVAERRFRPDLYYRLNVLSFQVPPLRQRRQDIEPLAQGMVAHFADRFRKPRPAISPGALAALHACPWLGNIRQLANAVQHAVLVGSGPELVEENLPVSVRQPPSVGRPFPNRQRVEASGADSLASAAGRAETTPGAVRYMRMHG